MKPTSICIIRIEDTKREKANGTFRDEFMGDTGAKFGEIEFRYRL